MPQFSYHTRSLEPILKQAAKEFPALVLTGPRQSGKTTLLEHLFGKTHRRVSLEPPDVRLAATQDPRGFLTEFKAPVFFDEIQYAPSLFPYLKEEIDRHRGRYGQYILTGSQNLQLLESVTESLAGRAAIFRLLPLTIREITQDLNRPFPWESKVRTKAASAWSKTRIWDQIVRGMYPEIATSSRKLLSTWHGSYIQTYLERDVRSLRQVGDLTSFQIFLRALAAQHGQLLDLTHLAGSIGVAVNTAKAWLSVLEATHQIVILRPYYANLRKRLVKAPKIYFTDSGTVCYLVDLRDGSHASRGPMAGALWEGFVVLEIIKTFFHRGETPRVYFWRTSDGHEVDIVVEQKGVLVPIEVKATATPQPSMAKDIRLFQELFGSKAAPGYMVHSGTERLPLAPRVTALPFRLL